MNRDTDREVGRQGWRVPPRSLKPGGLQRRENALRAGLRTGRSGGGVPRAAAELAGAGCQFLPGLIQPAPWAAPAVCLRRPHHPPAWAPELMGKILPSLSPSPCRRLQSWAPMLSLLLNSAPPSPQTSQGAWAGVPAGPAPPAARLAPGDPLSPLLLPGLGHRHRMPGTGPACPSWGLCVARAAPTPAAGFGERAACY